MESILRFIKMRFSGYTLLLMLFSAYLLLFVDSKQLKQLNLQKEAKLSRILGIIYAAAAALFFIINMVVPSY